MSIEKNVQFVKDFFAAMGSGDKQRLLSLGLLTHSIKNTNFSIGVSLLG